MKKKTKNTDIKKILAYLLLAEMLTKLLLAKLLLAKMLLEQLLLTELLLVGLLLLLHPCCMSIPAESSGWRRIHIELLEHCSSRSDQRSFSCYCRLN
jgi:hypothetical protein